MSITAIAYTIVGSSVAIEDFYTRTEQSVHTECANVGPGPYCASCGKPVGATETVTTPIEGFDEDGGEEGEGSIGGIDLVYTGRSGSEEVFVTVFYEEGNSWDYHNDKPGKPRRMEPFDMDAAREKVRAVLEPLGLWDPEKFGIWTALYLG